MINIFILFQQTLTGIVYPLTNFQ